LDVEVREKFGRDMDGELSEKAKSIFGGVFPIRTRPVRSRNSSAEKFCSPIGEDADAR
jgi:hypothetical protein